VELSPVAIIGVSNSITETSPQPNRRGLAARVVVIILPVSGPLFGSVQYYSQ